MRKLLVLMVSLGLSFGFFACTPLVKTDLKSLSENPLQYKGKQVVVVTDIKSLVENPEDYYGKRVEITGYVRLNGFRRTGDWGFILEDEEGRSVKCYEWKYRVEAWILPSVALRRAEREKAPVTVVGKVGKSLKIELDWIEYGDQHYDTDYLPYSALRAYHHYHGYRPPGIGGSWQGK